MALSKDDLQQIRDVVIEVVAPMFEYQTEYLGGRMDGLETRMDGLETRMVGIESRMDKSEKTSETFRHEVNVRFRALEEKLDEQTLTIQERIENISEDIDLLFELSRKYEAGTEQEKEFMRLTIERQVPILYRSLETIAKKAGVKLPVPSD